MSLHEAPRTVAELRFNDGNGKSVTLTDFRGKIVLLNIWATCCGPCREEMPTLDRLQERLGGQEFEVVALSIDRAGIGVVSEFYAEIRDRKSVGEGKGWSVRVDLGGCRLIHETKDLIQ